MPLGHMATQSWTTLKLPMAQLAMVELNRLTNALFELCDRAHYLEIPQSGYVLGRHSVALYYIRAIEL